MTSQTSPRVNSSLNICPGESCCLCSITSSRWFKPDPRSRGFWRRVRASRRSSPAGSRCACAGSTSLLCRRLTHRIWSACTPEDLTRYAAVTLFVQRARAIKPTFALTTALAPVIAAICARLDGIPLALELAAARIKLLSPQALLARLDERLALLTNGPADLPERQQTMRRAIEWSYDLLGASEQRLFRRLAIFVDGWTVEAAEAVCCGTDLPVAHVLDGLGSLVSSSLVLQVEEASGEPRFRLLQLLREYGWERLVAQGEAPLLRSRHADYYRSLAEKAAPEMQGPHQRCLGCTSGAGAFQPARRSRVGARDPVDSSMACGWGAPCTGSGTCMGTHVRDAPG